MISDLVQYGHFVNGSKVTKWRLKLKNKACCCLDKDSTEYGGPGPTHQRVERYREQQRGWSVSRRYLLLSQICSDQRQGKTSTELDYYYCYEKTSQIYDHKGEYYFPECFDNQNLNAYWETDGRLTRYRYLLTYNIWRTGPSGKTHF